MLLIISFGVKFAIAEFFSASVKEMITNIMYKFRQMDIY